MMLGYTGKFNVLMAHYTGHEGGGGDGENAFDLANASVDPSYNFITTPFNFTDPPRFFKANDPYYFEIDNIPLKQIHENCLWLRDQIIGKELNVTGISTRAITDVQPFVTNSDRSVFVQPGKFTARVNDAYSLNDIGANFMEGDAIVDFTRTPIYKTLPVTLSDDTFRTIVGSVVTNIFYNNGLYDQYQHHASILVTGEINDGTVPDGPIILTTSFNPTFLDSGSLTFEDLPKIKTAVWQQISNSNILYPPYKPDLQQLSVDFCRKWGGVFRTAVVNVPNQLSIQIPIFDENDYLDKDLISDPQVRIDLLFIYTHPIDTADTFIANDTGTGPERLTYPRLGLVKGAGAILTPQQHIGGGGEYALDIINDPTLIGTPDWEEQAGVPDKFYNETEQLSEIADLSIAAPMSDQIGTDVTNPPFPNLDTGYSFPSPDDLLNLAPLISQDALSQSLSTIGQSVLPLCYIIVKKYETVIKEEDIIDIRPFLRTAELTYNERSGLGASNPPVSLANPVTGKEELYNAVQAIRDYTDVRIAQVTEDLTFIHDISPPKMTLMFQRTGMSSTFITIRAQSLHNNSPDSGVGPYGSVNGQKVFRDFYDGSWSSGEGIRMIPGRYLIEGFAHGYPEDYSGQESFTHFTLSIRDRTEAADTLFWPLPEDDFELRARIFRIGNGEDRNTELSEGIGFSTILDIPNTVDSGGQYTGFALGLHMQRGGGNSGNITARANVTVTRLSNVDGTTGPIH